jgi:hypothetical protein
VGRAELLTTRVSVRGQAGQLQHMQHTQTHAAAARAVLTGMNARARARGAVHMVADRWEACWLTEWSHRAGEDVSSVDFDTPAVVRALLCRHRGPGNLKTAALVSDQRSHSLGVCSFAVLHRRVRRLRALITVPRQM